MTKKIVAVLGGVAMLLPIAASASVVHQDFGFRVNDKSTDSIDAGDNVKVSSAVDVNGGDQIEYVRDRFVNSNGDIMVNSCKSVGTIQDANDRTITVTVDTPSDLPEGTYDVRRLYFGIAGEERSAGCDLANDVGSEQTWENRLFVDDNNGDNDNDNGGNSSSGGNSGSDAQTDNEKAIADLQALIASLTAQLAGLGTVVGSLVPDAVCAQLPTGVAYGSHNATGLQTFLMANGQSIGYGATGYFGDQTQAALNGFKAAHKCR